MDHRDTLINAITFAHSCLCMEFLGAPQASSSEIDKRFWIHHPNLSPPHYSNNVYHTYRGFSPLPAGVLPPSALSIACSASTTSPVANLKKKKKLNKTTHFPPITLPPTFLLLNLTKLNLNHAYPLISK